MSIRTAVGMCNLLDVGSGLRKEVGGFNYAEHRSRVLNKQIKSWLMRPESVLEITCLLQVRHVCSISRVSLGPVTDSDRRECRATDINLSGLTLVRLTS